MVGFPLETDMYIYRWAEHPSAVYLIIIDNLINNVCKRHRTPLHAAFIDLRKAFPSVARGPMFERLRDIGVPTPLILAIRSFYMINISRLRIGSYLSRPFLVSLGLLEGSILSPLLFVIIFSFVWDFVQPSPFPSHDDNVRPRVDSVWILAFADDLVILSPSRTKLQTVLRQLDTEMARFNLQMSLQKTETMTFRNHSPTHVPSDPITIRSCALKEVDSFKYLGVQMSQTGSLTGHCLMAPQRARLSASLTVNILHKLAINDVARIRSYFLCFVQAQLYGLELLPVSVVPQVEQIRNSFMRTLFKLPRGTPSELFYVLFPSFTPAVLCLKRRLSFFQRCLRHKLSCVTSSALVDTVALFVMSCGWMHESFLFFKSIEPSANHARFDFLSDVSHLCEVTASEEAFSFQFIRTSSSVCMSFFRLLSSSSSLKSFREALSRLELSLQHIVLVFLTSQMRWCFFEAPSQTCPLCYRKSWYWEHFFECQKIVPLLSSRGVCLAEFRLSARDAKWSIVFDTIAHVLLCWHFALVSIHTRRTCQYDPSVFRSLSNAAKQVAL
jgi:hypothetical protein